MFNKILVPIDLSTETTTANLCQVANNIAEKYGAEISLMTVVPDYGSPLVASFFPEGAQTKMKQEMNDKLKELANTHFTVPTSIQLKQGKRRQVILNEIEDNTPDLVVMGCRRKKSRRNQRLLGATGTAITDRASCSVIVIR